MDFVNSIYSNSSLTAHERKLTQTRQKIINYKNRYITVDIYDNSS